MGKGGLLEDYYSNSFSNNDKFLGKGTVGDALSA